MMVQVISTDGLWRCHAESVPELADWLLTAPRFWKAKIVTEGGHGRDWSLGYSYAEVHRLARTGWSEGAKLISDRLASHLPARSRMNKWRNDVAGDLPDIPRHIAGLPDCMRRRGNDNAHRPVISIFVNNWINAMISGKAMANYGAAMVAAIDQIENTGKRVELIAGTIAPSFNTRNQVMSTTWVAKQAQDPIDYAALAFSLAHPGASRRFGWDAWMRSDKKEDSNFGLAMGFDAKDEHFIDPLPGMIKLRGLLGEPTRCLTMEDAIVFVREQINRTANEALVGEEEA